MKKKSILLFVIAGIFAVVGVTVKLAVAASAQKHGPVYKTPPPQAIQRLLTPIPVSTPAEPACDFLGSPGVSVGTQISQSYGEIRNCFYLDGSWVILTEGLKRQDGTRQSGVVAMYRCPAMDTACQDSQADHPITGWQIYQPPCPGELSLGADGLPGKFRIMGTCASYFEIASGAFTDK